MIFDQSFELVQVFDYLLNGLLIVTNGMAWHWDFELMAFGNHFWEDFLQPLSSYLSLFIICFLRVFECKETLSDWV